MIFIENMRLSTKKNHYNIIPISLKQYLDHCGTSYTGYFWEIEQPNQHDPGLGTKNIDFSSYCNT